MESPLTAAAESCVRGSDVPVPRPLTDAECQRIAFHVVQMRERRQPLLGALLAVFGSLALWGLLGAAALLVWRLL